MLGNFRQATDAGVGLNVSLAESMADAEQPRGQTPDTVQLRLLGIMRLTGSHNAEGNMSI
jgi:hypothetical protein